MADAAEGTAGIRVREEAEAAALTSTSLRERWRELGAGVAAGVRVGGALAGGRTKLCLPLHFEVQSFLTFNMRSYFSVLRLQRCFSPAEVDCGGRNDNNNVITVCSERLGF